ncbi:hypothetical protein H5410_060227 [Solanum commersonii]|uniref:Uncharacterized protein n=1 Tax=Solanum commersonii TaxID=4109 RepID=A0A9J5W4I2_SOLCO|nr:hypothetical protein H5410_060227 [Solanum commersonii]
MVEFITKGEGNMQHVELWDVTKASNPRNDENAYVEMTMPSEDYALVCADLFTNRGLSVGDETGLYWDINLCNFKFKNSIRGGAVTSIWRKTSRKSPVGLVRPIKAWDFWALLGLS